MPDQKLLTQRVIVRLIFTDKDHRLIRRYTAFAKVDAFVNLVSAVRTISEGESQSEYTPGITDVPGTSLSSSILDNREALCFSWSTNLLTIIIM